MTKQDHLDRVWDIIERVGVCVPTTRFAGGLRARPLEARPDRTAGIIWFVTDLRSSKEHEIESEHDVGLVLVDAKANAYLSITARADVRRAPAKTSEIWKATDDTLVARTGRSERLRATRSPANRGTMGLAVEQRRRRVRVHQGAAHRRKAEPRRESQGDGFNVTRAERQVPVA
jgi:general stress protein 26